MPEVLRESQARILSYSGGKMGISAVPGSGKTWTLSRLAAKLISTAGLQPDQEVLVVTFSNSAVDNFSTRIGQLLRQSGVLSGLGYHVRTLHGLANDIIHQRPELAGLTNDYQILDQTEADAILTHTVDAWLKLNPHFFDDLLAPGYISLDTHEPTHKAAENIPGLVKSVGLAFIRTAKDLRLTPAEITNSLRDYPMDTSLLQMGLALYQDYEAALNYRGAIDFDDLIWLAYQCLENDPDLVALLRHRWPYILEDEAQDSSVLQEKILRQLVGTDGNWVRVGDPNQAIYASFTTANPNLLKRFLAEPDVRKEDLPESGRSCQSIIDLANSMIDWVQYEHPNREVRDALTPPYIQPTKPGDPQPNPPDEPGAVEFVNWQMSDQAELDFLVERVQSWLEKNPESTVVVLAFLNDRVAKIADALRNANIPVVDSLMNLPDPTRLSAGAIANIFESLLNPDNPKKLAVTFKVWKRKFREDQAAWDQIEAGARLIQGCPALENYLYPQEGVEWLENLKGQHPDEILTDLAAFREVVRRWHQAALLTPDQLILAVAQDLELDAVELATIHKIALLIRNLQDMHPEWSLEDLNSELVDISKNLRRFENLSNDAEGFDPQAYKGQVVVATMHKAKGLEWDKVFLSSANNYDYPSGEEGEAYRAETYYLRDNLNLQAEALAQLKNLAEGLPIIDFRLGAYSPDDRNEVIRERLRLFYVGITRARRSLTVSYNTGRLKNNKEALVCTALRNRMNLGG